MNPKSANNQYKNLNDKSSPEYQLKSNNYKNIFPFLSYPNQNQDYQKNIQYFPISTKESFTGQHTIYLAAEDNNNLNDYSVNNEISNKNNIKNKNNLILLPQRSIDLQINNSKFNYLLNFPIENGEKNNNKKVKRNLDEIYTIKEKDQTNNFNYKNIKDNFISTTKNVFEPGINKESKKLFHSFSVENYSDKIFNK